MLSGENYESRENNKINLFLVRDIPVSSLACSILHCYFSETFLICRWLPFSPFTVVIPNHFFLTQVPPVLLTFGIKLNSQTSQRKQNSSGLCALAFLPPFLQLCPYAHPVYLPLTGE